MKRTIRGAGFLVALTLLSGPGCARTIDDACHDLAASRCAYYQACSPAHVATSYGDVATCRARVAASCAPLPELDGASLGVAEIEACAAAYDLHSCDDLLSGAVPEPCRFTGEKANGASCVTGAQCQSSFCDVPAEGSCGQCAAVRKAGAPCSKAGSPCEAGLYCGPEETCTRLGIEGETCSLAMPCGPRFFCAAGQCASLAALGEPCDHERTCDPLPGLHCDKTFGICEKQQIVGAGEPCSPPGPSAEVVCAASAVCEAGACVPRPGPGEACEASPNAPADVCAAGLTCISGECSSLYPACI